MKAVAISPLSASVSYYEQVFQKTGAEISVQDFLDKIALPTYKQAVDAIRAEPDAEKRRELKAGTLPAATIAGTFTTKTHDGIKQHSGLMAMDFDHLNELLPDALCKLQSDPYTCVAWTSASGNGLCVLVKIKPEKWAESFAGLSRYYAEKHGLIVDEQCKNVNRLRFVSHDPNLFINEESALFTHYLKSAEQKKREKPISTHVHTESDIEYVLQQIEARSLDVCPSYEDWLKVGFAFVSGYGEDGRDYYHRVSQFGEKYDADKCNKQYSYLVGYGARAITISTFYYLAKQAGCDIMTAQTKEIVRQASAAKRNHSNQSSAVNQLAEMANISPEISRPIVEQVFNSPIEIETGETIYEQAITLLKQKGLLFNEVSRMLLDSSGESIEERGLNNIYIECLNLFDGKLKRSDFDTLIKSDVVPTCNPLRNFFTRYRDRKPVGAIQALAQTIKTDTGFAVDEVGHFDPNYTEYFLRKWLIGIVANIHKDKDVCSLMLVLTGKQGTGKTEWFRRLLPDELHPYYAETKFDREKDDEILMTQKIILMNDELEGLTIQDAKKLKSLTSKQEFTLREPYGRANVTLRRLAVLCGTSNPKEVINDPTGNRRIIPINIDFIDFPAYNAIDKIDPLIEAYHDYMAGIRHTLTVEDIKRLNDNSGEFQGHSIERQLIEQYLASPTGNGGEMVEHLSAIDILTFLEKQTSNRKLNDRRLSMELGSLGFEKKQRRGNGRRAITYEVVKLM